MSRILKTMIVLLAIAAMVAPAMAEDRLTLGGQMRVRSWYKDFDQDHTNTYADQRLRVGGKLSVAEGVSITFRTDITESTWGAGNTFGSGRDGSTQQWDRAHIDLTLGNSHIRAGQQFAMYGNVGGGVINTQSNGIRYDYNGDLKFSTFLFLVDNNNQAKTSDEVIVDPDTGAIVVKPGVPAGNAADYFLYGANLGYAGDNYKANLYFGYQNNSHPGIADFDNGEVVDQDGESVFMVGVDTVYNLDSFTIKGEFDYFGGDASEDVDAFGTQFFLDVSMATSEALTLGGQFYYALGDDEDRQYTVLGDDFNGYDPLFDVGTSLSNEQINVNRPFDLAKAVILTGIGTENLDLAKGNTSTGVVGGRFYAEYQAGDSVKLGASVAYMEPEEDKNFKDFNSAMFYGVGASYALMANTSLQAQFNYIDADIDHAKVDSAVLGGVGLFVNF